MHPCSAKLKDKINYETEWSNSKIAPVPTGGPGDKSIQRQLGPPEERFNRNVV